MKDEAPGPRNVEEVIPTVADKKISPKAPTASRSPAQAATHVGRSSGCRRPRELVVKR
jgi:hypothetical protein